MADVRSRAVRKVRVRQRKAEISDRKMPIGKVVKTEEANELEIASTNLELAAFQMVTYKSEERFVEKLRAAALVYAGACSRAGVPTPALISVGICSSDPPTPKECDFCQGKGNLGDPITFTACPVCFGRGKI